MGSCCSSQGVKKPHEQNTEKGCRSCGAEFSQDLLTMHRCRYYFPKLEIPPPNVRVSSFTTVNEDLAIILREAQEISGITIPIKAPVNEQRTKYKWGKQPAMLYSDKLAFIKKENIVSAPFQVRYQWFRHQLEKKRIPWTEGADRLRVDKRNLIFTSYVEVQKLNPFKEIKVHFDDSPDDIDAGGVLREWMFQCIQEIFAEDIGLFKKCNTDENYYKIVWDESSVEQILIPAISLLGIIIGKALFEKIPLSCHLNRTLLRHLLMQTIYLPDVYSFDKDFHQSWSYILENNDVSEMELFMCEHKYHENKTVEIFQFETNGKDVKVCEENKKNYLSILMDLHFTKSIVKYIKPLRTALHSIVPGTLLNIFSPEEFEMMLCGPDTVDVQEWRNQTCYEGYSGTEDVIVWFWQILTEFDDQMRRQVLHYCTSSSSVPIEGFSQLMSNRGEVKPFTIRKISLDQSNPYPKSHTCFNRLELPPYESLDDVRRILLTVMPIDIFNTD